MFPVHCNEVGFKKVEFQLNREEIHKVAIGKQVYWKTRYLLLSNVDQWAIVRTRSEGSGIFREVHGADVVAESKDIEYVENPNVNVLSVSAMAKVASKSNKPAVVVKGAFDHMSFIFNEEAIFINVYDVVPPAPSKLVSLTEKVLAQESIDRPVVISPKVLDLHSLVVQSDKIVMLPCRTSGFKLSKDYQKVLFLDETPHLSSSEAKAITLIGCDLSRKVFRTHYNSSPKFRNICPKKRALNNPDELGICLCCLQDCDFKREGNLLVLPWGVTSKQIETAIKSLWE